MKKSGGVPAKNTQNIARKKKIEAQSKQAKKYNKTLSKVKGDATKIPGFAYGRKTK